MFLAENGFYDPMQYLDIELVTDMKLYRNHDVMVIKNIPTRLQSFYYKTIYNN